MVEVRKNGDVTEYSSKNVFFPAFVLEACTVIVEKVPKKRTPMKIVLKKVSID